MIEEINSNATLAIAGTASNASGIAAVTVNGEPADRTLDWSANVMLRVCNEITYPIMELKKIETTRLHKFPRMNRKSFE